MKEVTLFTLFGKVGAYMTAMISAQRSLSCKFPVPV
jgi:hypothetical protein